MEEEKKLARNNRINIRKQKRPKICSYNNGKRSMLLLCHCMISAGMEGKPKAINNFWTISLRTNYAWREIPYLDFNKNELKAAVALCPSTDQQIKEGFWGQHRTAYTVFMSHCLWNLQLVVLVLCTQPSVSNTRMNIIIARWTAHDTRNVQRFILLGEGIIILTTYPGSFVLSLKLIWQRWHCFKGRIRKGNQATAHNVRAHELDNKRQIWNCKCSVTVETRHTQLIGWSSKTTPREAASQNTLCVINYLHQGVNITSLKFLLK